MRLRQEGGEISPASWLGGAGLTLGIAAFPFLFTPWIPMISAVIICVTFSGLSALCLFAAGRQHYTNQGKAAAGLMVPPASHPVPPIGQLVQTAEPPRSATKAVRPRGAIDGSEIALNDDDLRVLALFASNKQYYYFEEDIAKALAGNPQKAMYHVDRLLATCNVEMKMRREQLGYGVEGRYVESWSITPKGRATLVEAKLL